MKIKTLAEMIWSLEQNSRSSSWIVATCKEYLTINSIVAIENRKLLNQCEFKNMSSASHF